jgi:hypothetical protein
MPPGLTALGELVGEWLGAGAEVGAKLGGVNTAEQTIRNISGKVLPMCHRKYHMYRLPIFTDELVAPRRDVTLRSFATNCNANVKSPELTELFIAAVIAASEYTVLSTVTVYETCNETVALASTLTRTLLPVSEIPRTLILLSVPFRIVSTTNTKIWLTSELL